MRRPCGRTTARPGAGCFVVSGLPALREQIDRAVGAMAGARPSVCVLRGSAEEQSERILRRARGLYAVEYGGASSGATPEALAETTAAASRGLEPEGEPKPHSRVVRPVGIS